MSCPAHFPCQNVTNTMNNLLDNSEFGLVVGIVIGLVLGAACTYVALRMLIKPNQKADAGKRLRNALTDLLAWREMEEPTWCPQNWDDFLMEQYRAAKSFSRFLRKKKRIRFEDACARYFKPENDKKTKEYYWSHPEELEKRMDAIIELI